MRADNLFLYYEFQHCGNTIKNGHQVRIKNDWRRYIFFRIEHDATKDHTDVVVFDHHGERRRFHISRLEGRIVKRSLKDK